MIQMSNITGEGVADVKSAACEILLQFREAENNKSGKKTQPKDLTGLDKIYMAQPKIIRDNRKRTPNIPQSVQIEKIEMQKELLHEKYMETEEDKLLHEEKRLKEGDINLLEKKNKE